jgi:hypothetical protein
MISAVTASGIQTVTVKDALSEILPQL